MTDMNAHQPDVSRWSLLSAEPTILSSSHRSGWRGFEFQEIAVPVTGTFQEDRSIESIPIMICQICGPMKIRFGGRRKPFLDAPRYPRLFVPGDVSIGAWEGAQRGIHLIIEQNTVERLLHLPFHDRLFERREYLDSGISQLMHALHLDVKSGHPSGALLGETITTAILQRLVADSSPLDVASKQVGLSQREFARIRAWIEDHLALPFSLQDLAAEVGVSVRQLHRNFLRNTGMPPYRYILIQRTERARQLIVAGRLSLSEVALAVGFYDQAHMAHTFRKLFGAPPSHFGNTERQIHLAASGLAGFYNLAGFSKTDEAPES